MSPQLGDRVEIECPACGESTYPRAMLGTRQIQCGFCDSIIEVSFGQAVNGELVVNSELLEER